MAAITTVASAHPGGVGGGGGQDGPNPLFFTHNGQAVYLTGSHTWSNLQEQWSFSFPVIFDFEGYLDLLDEHNHNFIRLWRGEFPAYKYPADSEYRYSWPHPWARTGPGAAGDGSLKFNLNQFDPEFFDRLRERCIAAGKRGKFVSIMLFEGHGLAHATEGWFSHPFAAGNNVNGVNGDANGDGQGQETHTLAVPAVTAYQQAYVQKVIDTVNDLDNVMYEISNESPGSSIPWQNYWIDYIHAYEQSMPNQHLVMFSSPFGGGYDDAMFTSGADAVSPGSSLYLNDPPPNVSDKIIINDTDHLFGCGSNVPMIWKSITRGLNPIHMDSYYPNSPFCPPPDPAMRINMGYAHSYAQRMNLGSVLASPELSSTGYCLADPYGLSYLAYLPSGGTVYMYLGAASQPLHVEWLNPATGGTLNQAPVNPDPGSWIAFAAPFSGHAVLFLHSEPQNMPGDVNGDGVVDINDLFQVLWNWGPCPGCQADLNGDNVVDVTDLFIVLGAWS